MPRWQLLTEAALLIVVALLVGVAIGRDVPFFRTLLVLAVALLLTGVAMGAVALLRRARSPARFRLLVADVDGTLVGADQAISPRGRRAISLARARGIHVALCTGRGPVAAQRFIAELDLTGPQIFFDGALVAAPDGSCEVYRCAPDRAALRALVAAAADRELPIELHTHAAHFVAWQCPETDWHGAIQGAAPRLANLAHVLDEEAPLKAELVLAGPDKREDARRLSDRFAGQLRFSWAKVAGYEQYDLVNIVHPAVSKGEALRHLAEHLGVPLAAVLAVGDGPNDIPLLETAGLGVAMGDAPPAVRAAAAAVTASSAEDGLAIAVERYLLV